MSVSGETQSEQKPRDKQAVKSDVKAKIEAKLTSQKGPKKSKKVPRGEQEKVAAEAVRRSVSDNSGATATTTTGPTVETPTVPPADSGGQASDTAFKTWEATGKYLGQDLRPRVERLAVNPESQYLTEMLDKANKVFAQQRVGRSSAALATFVSDHLTPLIESVEGAESDTEKGQARAQSREAEAASRKSEAARIAANVGDGGYPVGKVEGSGESTVMVVLNRVVPAQTGRRYVVWLEFHQNKHQSKKIPQLGTWTKRPGDLFGWTKDLDWHKQNTAEWVLTWLQSHLEDIRKKKGETETPDKTATKDDNDVTYDLKAWMEGEVVVGSYHCNPAKSET
jgi:hypothetical protein